GRVRPDRLGPRAPEPGTHDRRRDRRRARARGRRRPASIPLAQTSPGLTAMRIEPAERVDDDTTLEWFREYRRTRDRTLRNTLVEHYLELARALARRFANRNEPLDDLEQVAMLGVLKAVE